MQKYEFDERIVKINPKGIVIKGGNVKKVLFNHGFIYFLCVIFLLLSIRSNNRVYYISIYSILLILGIYIDCSSLWSLKMENDALYIVRGRKKYKIDFENLINVKKISTHSRYSYMEYLRIKFKINNEIRHIDLKLYEQGGFVRCRYVQNEEIQEFINCFEIRGFEPIIEM